MFKRSRFRFDDIPPTFSLRGVSRETARARAVSTSQLDAKVPRNNFVYTTSCTTIRIRIRIPRRLARAPPPRRSPRSRGRDLQFLHFSMGPRGILNSPVPKLNARRAVSWPFAIPGAAAVTHVVTCRDAAAAAASARSGYGRAIFGTRVQLTIQSCRLPTV